MNKILIKNGRVIDPANGIDDILDVVVVDGKVENVAKDISDADAEVIDATGMWVTPGLIDIHVHLREPGFTHKETIATGTRSAAIGGFTTICPMANVNPVPDNEIIIEYINLKAAREGVVNVVPIGAITKGLKGEELADIGAMHKVGIKAISDDGLSVDNAGLLKTAMKYATMFGLPILSHCEDKTLTAGGQINAGATAEKLGLKGISADSESTIVARDIALARSTGAHIHICHVSVIESLEYIREAKARGQKVTAEVAPHHFILIDEDIKDYDANFKMHPPLRSRADREALKQALADGTIEVIATDHAPHHEDEKNCEFEAAANGIVGLETSFPLSLTLVDEGLLTPSQLIEKMTINPAKVMNIDKGTLSIGAVADISILDPNHKWALDKTKLYSLSKNTPFDGWQLKGKCRDLIVKGQQVVKSGELCK